MTETINPVLLPDGLNSTNGSFHWNPSEFPRLASVLIAIHTHLAKISQTHLIVAKDEFKTATLEVALSPQDDLIKSIADLQFRISMLDASLAKESKAREESDDAIAEGHGTEIAKLELLLEIERENVSRWKGLADRRLREFSDAAKKINALEADLDRKQQSVEILRKDVHDAERLADGVIDGLPLTVQELKWLFTRHLTAVIGNAGDFAALNISGSQKTHELNSALSIGLFAKIRKAIRHELEAEASSVANGAEARASA